MGISNCSVIGLYHYSYIIFPFVPETFMENSICNQDRQGAYKTVYGYFNAAAYMRIFFGALEKTSMRLFMVMWEQKRSLL